MTPTLDRAAIAARIPHEGRMCLLDEAWSWSATNIHCTASSHADADNPLRTASGLLAPAAIEYAAQAMALHGALLASKDEAPQPGYLASVRQVRLHAPRLDDAASPLHVHVQRIAGDATLVSYAFDVKDGQGRALAEGRATVVLNTPLP